jgi:hypothetical protein
MSEKLNKILNDRERQYGDAKRNFTNIGIGWGAILGIDSIPAHVVALMYDFGKTIRCVANPEIEDSWLDKEGYTKHGREISRYEP